METYGKILTIASPLFLLLVLIEKAYGHFARKDSFKAMDMISSLTSGYTNSVKDVLGLSVSILSYEWMVRHWTVYKIESTIWVYIIAFVSLDLTGYLVHRMAHSINFFLE